MVEIRREESTASPDVLASLCEAVVSYSLALATLPEDQKYFPKELADSMPVPLRKESDA